MSALMPDTRDHIYFDNNATTMVDPVVVETMMPFLTKRYGNPSSAYRFGQDIRSALDTAREQVASLLGCEPREVVFTSCGTESTNAAIHSALLMDRDRQHVVTTRVEHSATMKTCEALARKGYEVTWLGVDDEGQLRLDELERAIRPDTALVSIMWANNETGVLFPLETIAAMVRKHGAVFHTDAVQTVGKLPVRLAEVPVQFLSLSGHKLHAPKGVGALYVNRRLKYSPFMLGGGQEEGKRAGTENVPYIVGMGKAAELAHTHMEQEQTRVRALRDRFEEGMLALVPGTAVNGNRDLRLPNTSSLRFAGVDSAALILLLDNAGICCSAGSACTTGQAAPSHVLKAMGLSDQDARGSLRFSFSRYNTEAEVETALATIPGLIARARAQMPTGGQPTVLA
jgi:cysteine desulfurase